MRRLWVATIVAVLLASQCAVAQEASHVRYKWQDAQGLVHFSDSLSAEAMKFGYTLVNDQGVVVGRVDRQLTPEERAVANRLAEAQAKQQRAARDQANADLQMLNAYPDEEMYQLSQKQTLDTIDQKIRTTQINLRSQEKALADLLARAADLERAKQQVPPALADTISKRRNVVTDQRNNLTRQRAERTETLAAQKTQLAHYREVKAAHDKGE